MNTTNGDYLVTLLELEVAHWKDMCATGGNEFDQLIEKLKKECNNYYEQAKV
tara:strand:+ start:565 stop:720 length:156 start_codon:yes stop_codon:yes gene_type:complete